MDTVYIYLCYVPRHKIQWQVSANKKFSTDSTILLLLYVRKPYNLLEGIGANCLVQKLKNEGNELKRVLQ
jgi:hypothetical protein